jgi:hypothetical protein
MQSEIREDASARVRGVLVVEDVCCYFSAAANKKHKQHARFFQANAAGATNEMCTFPDATTQSKQIRKVSGEQQNKGEKRKGSHRTHLIRVSATLLVSRSSAICEWS